MIILGVFGPWQMIFLLIILGGIIGGLIAIFSSRAKHKAKAETLSSVIDADSKQQAQAQKSDDEKYAKLERLNKLRQEGALTEEEFLKEKAKVLG